MTTLPRRPLRTLSLTAAAAAAATLVLAAPASAAEIVPPPAWRPGGPRAAGYAE